MSRPSSLLSSLRRTGAGSSTSAGSAVAAATSGGKAAFSKAAATSGTLLSRIGDSVMLGCTSLGEGLSSNARRQLMWWLGGTTLLTYGVIVLGGAVRINRCTMSMTEFKLSGVQLPMSLPSWHALYDKYCSTDQYARADHKPTLKEFQSVAKMEFGLKVCGWLLGLAVVVPGAYFARRGYINSVLAKRLGLLLLVGGTQVVVGNTLLRGGLKAPAQDWDAPNFRPYRPGFHLISAFTIYSMLLWTALDLAYPTPLLARFTASVQAASQPVRLRVLLYGAVVAFTAMTGAFVAGKDAGRAYNTYPDMDGKFFPDEYWDMSLRPIWRNTFENTAANQFHHRMMAATSALAVLALWPYVRASSVPAPVKHAVDAMLGVTIVQMGLGIWTLLGRVPASLGTLHQANSLNSITTVLVALHMLRPTSRAGPYSQVLARYGTSLAAAVVTAVGLAISTQP